MKFTLPRKRLTRRGNDTILPIIGDRVTEITLDATRHPSLVFARELGPDSVLQLADRIVLSRGEQRRVLDGAIPGLGFDPRSLSPMVECLGNIVTEAFAKANGELRIEFSNNLILSVSPTTGYEAWHFQSPRPGLLPGGDVRYVVTLTGANGYLI